MHEVLIEAKNLTVYKKLLRVLGEYTDKFSSTGVTRLFNNAKDKGIKIIPKDKRAIDILNHVLSIDSVPSAVQHFLNLRFSDLPIELKPIYKNGNRNEVSFWEKDGNIHDKVSTLVSFNDEKGGAWVDVNGKKVVLVDMTKDKED